MTALIESPTKSPLINGKRPFNTVSSNHNCQDRLAITVAVTQNKAGRWRLAGRLGPGHISSRPAGPAVANSRHRRPGRDRRRRHCRSRNAVARHVTPPGSSAGRREGVGLDGGNGCRAAAGSLGPGCTSVTAGMTAGRFGWVQLLGQRLSG